MGVRIGCEGGRDRMRSVDRDMDGVSRPAIARAQCTEAEQSLVKTG